MRLRALAPSCLELFPNAVDIVKAIESTGVKTVDDLLAVYDTPESIYDGLPPAIRISLPDFRAFCEQLVFAAAAPGQSGLEAFKQEELQESGRFGGETGVEQLDALMGGSFGSYTVTEFSGVAMTQLVLWIVLRHLALYGESSALWLDTTGEFPAEQASSAIHYIVEKDSETALGRLQVSHAFNLTAAHNALDALRTTLDALTYEEHEPCPIRFLVVAPVNPLFSFNLSGTSSQGHAMLTTFTRQLSSLARAYRMSVFVINNPVSCQPHNPLSAFSATITKPGLGPTFTYLCDHTVWIGNAEDLFGDQDETLMELQNVSMGGAPRQVYIAEILRSRHVLSRTWQPFIIEGGVAILPIQL
ncbi:hypothetical protein FRB99_006063 [Tulasnella sp. 403]|nr:hypothetical protein FRB99_006063 [Tulasnella sp. 403]